MIHIYFIYTFKCNLVYIVFLMCKDVPHKFLLQMFIYKCKNGCREKHLKNTSIVLIQFYFYYNERYVILLLNLLI